MEQIKIIFFALASFFGIENGMIFSEITTVSVYPANKEIQIIHDKLFVIIQSESDSNLVLKQWDECLNRTKSDTQWAQELHSFPIKRLEVKSKGDTIQTILSLSYEKESDLRNLGIWYNTDTNQFSINHIPQESITTNDGNLDGNYWYFDGDNAFMFTIEPFMQVPDQYLKLKVPLRELLREHNKD